MRVISIKEREYKELYSQLCKKITIYINYPKGIQMCPSDNYPGQFKQKKGTEEYALPNMTTCSSDFMERPNKEFKLLQTD